MLLLKNIAKDFSDGREKRRVLFPTSLECRAGELTVLSGPSGSGKTTLLSIIGLVLTPSEGQMFIDDLEVTALSDVEAATIRLKRYGFVFQQAMLVEGLTILDNVMLSFAIQGEKPPADSFEKASALLKTLGLEGTAQMQPRLLSGGMKQRASIARALINDPPILIADEPTANLDTALSHEFLNIVADLRARNKTVIMTSHDPLVEQAGVVDVLVTMRDGRIVGNL